MNKDQVRVYGQLCRLGGCRTAGLGSEAVCPPARRCTLLHNRRVMSLLNRLTLPVPLAPTRFGVRLHSKVRSHASSPPILLPASHPAHLPCPPPQFDGSCGKCVRARGTEGGASGKWHVVKIVDMCPSCSHGDVDFSTTVRAWVAGWMGGWPDGWVGGWVG